MNYVCYYKKNTAHKFQLTRTILFVAVGGGGRGGAFFFLEEEKFSLPGGPAITDEWLFDNIVHFPLDNRKPKNKQQKLKVFVNKNNISKLVITTNECV